MPYTLITGASKGIGRYFAEECAKRNHNLLLVALPGDGLESMAGHLKEHYDVAVQYYTTDITQKGGIHAFYEWCNSAGITVNILINNAGMGLQGKFENISLDDNLKMMSLNNESMVLLTHLFLAHLRQFENGYILNVGSVASFIKLPYKAIYSGTKNFVLTFSNALHEELKADKICVTCLCPGPTNTNALVEARNKEHGFKARVLTLSAYEVAKIGIQGMFAQKPVVIPGNLNRFLVFLIKHLPASFSTKLSKKQFENLKINNDTPLSEKVLD